MGWKAVKDHYRIDYIVARKDEGLSIGSPFAPDAIRVKPDGTVETMFQTASTSIARVVKQLRADPRTLAALMAQPDVFTAAIPVYAARDGQVVQHLCEERGWPNVTHDGHLMYENHFFETPGEAAEHGLSEARAMNEFLARDLARIENQLLEARADLERSEVAIRSYEEMTRTGPHVHTDACGCGNGHGAETSS